LRHKINDVDALHQTCQMLWSLPDREYHDAAIDLLLKYKKLLNTDSIKMVEALMLPTLALRTFLYQLNTF
jgi:hypothetical protein